MKLRRILLPLFLTLGMLVLPATVIGGDVRGPSSEAIGTDTGTFSLRQGTNPDDAYLRLASFQAAETETRESTTITTYGDEGWVLSGPYFLRSADPEEPGEMELKFVYGFETSSGEEDENEFEFVLEWGMAENIEFILEGGAVIGNGGIEGNGDISEFGFHIRHWKETDWLPAFATRHLIRIPTGYHSSGVDYTLRGLFTKTIIPDKMRCHFNPYLTSVNGDNNDDSRPFQWGAAIGVDYRVSDDLLLIADYQHRSSEEEGDRNNHSLELGADWDFAEHQTLGLSTEIGVDGDDSGPNWGFKVSYILELGVPRLDAH